MTDEETIDIKTIEEWQKILDEFSQHQIEIEETFMGVCRYKWERFEEICSRVLKFFFDPNEKHGFRDLWFKALCQLIEYQEYCDIDKMKIELEVPTSNANEEQQNETEDTMQQNDDEDQNESDSKSNSKGRIDIILTLPSLVITIENKISAHLNNNPLDKYTQYIDKNFRERKKLFYVLTARTLTEAENDKAQKNGFDVIKYEDLFKNVESMLGKYVAKGEQKYLTFMLDFIQTIRNMVKEIELTEFENVFFADNKTVIGRITKKYNTWKNDVLKTRNTKTSELHKKIENQTSSKWELDTYKDVFLYNLSIIFKKGTKYQIGIESNFDFDDEKNKIGKFCIFITTWDMESWEPYKKIESLQNHPDIIGKDIGEINNNNRVYLHMRPIELKNCKDEKSYQDEIIKKLKEYYDFLKEITDNIDK